MSKLDLSLILACYNEGSTLRESLKHIKEVLDDSRFAWEIICIDDASLDTTPLLIEKFAKGKRNVSAYFHEQNVGRGGTVAEGIRKARGRAVGYIDVDLEVSPVYIPEFVRAVSGGADLAMGKRIYKERLGNVIRWLATRTYVNLVKGLLHLDFQDTEAGYKFFNRKKILPVLDKVKNKKWFFDTEIIARAVKAKLRIMTIPVLFIQRKEKKSTVRVFRDSWQYLMSLWKFSRTYK